MAQEFKLSPFAELTPKQRFALTLCSKGKTQKEIAYEMGIQRQSAHLLLSRARVKLKANTLCQAISRFSKFEEPY